MIMNVGEQPLMCEDTIAKYVNLISVTRVWQQSQVFLLIHAFRFNIGLIEMSSNVVMKVTNIPENEINRLSVV